MGPRMNRTIGIAVALLLGFSLSAFPFGIGAGIGGYTIDLSASFGKLEGAIAAAGTALGLSQSDIDALISEVEGGLSDITIVPLPLLYGTIEIGVPLTVIDSIRFTGGILTDDIIRGIASSVGEPIHQPLIDETFDTGAEQGSVSADVFFSSYLLQVEVAKRFDIFFSAFDIGLGASWIAGRISPQLDVQVPAQYESGVTDAIAALHLDGLSWSAVGLSAGIGIELGPPFLRLRAEGDLSLTLYEESGWWDVKVGGITAGIGITIRF